MMSAGATSLWLANLVCDTAGQLSFKAASSGGGDLAGAARWMRLARSPFLWIGLAAFVLELVFWLSFLSQVPLGMGVLVGSANIIAVLAGGHILFRERVTKSRLLALVMIGAGVALVGWGG
jgi:undecaprenyl phosphate-alpha-L-ara4N flippase subunit ArnE